MNDDRPHRHDHRSSDYEKTEKNEKKLAKQVKEITEDESANLDQARRNTKHLDQLEEEGYQ